MLHISAGGGNLGPKRKNLWRLPKRSDLFDESSEQVFRPPFWPTHRPDLIRPIVRTINPVAVQLASFFTKIATAASNHHLAISFC